MASYKIFIDYNRCPGPECCNLCKHYFDQLKAGDVHTLCGGQITVAEKSLLHHCETVTEAMKHCPREAIDFAEL